MNSRCIAILSVGQISVGEDEILILDDISEEKMPRDIHVQFLDSELFIAFDATHYRILKDVHNNFLADRKIPISLLPEEISDYLKDENHV